MAVTFDIVMEWTPNFNRLNISLRGFKKFSNFFFNDDVCKNDVIDFLKFHIYSAWVLRIKFILRKKPADMWKIKLLPFRKLNQNWKKLALIRFYCDSRKSTLWWRHQLEISPISSFHGREHSYQISCSYLF